MTYLAKSNNLRKTYGSGKKAVEAVRGVSLTLGEGEIFAFLGPNGAGKTTTVKMFGALVVPDGGWVEILGQSPFEDRGALRHLGAVLEGNRNLYWRLSVEENLEYFGVLRGMSSSRALRRGRELIERLGLTAKWRTPVRYLSRGQQQRAALAVALVHEPRVLLLDEPTLGLDVESAEELKRLIREIADEGRGVLLTTHQLQVAQELSHRVAIIDDGRIIAEEETESLVRRFSNDSYQIEIEGTLDDLKRQRLEQLGVQFVNGHFSFPGPTDAIYELIEIIRPTPIVRLERQRADLTNIFLELIREGRRQDVAVPD